MKDEPIGAFGRYSAAQMRNAAEIVAEGKERGLPRSAWVIAVATSLQESWLRNLANERVPASMDIPHQGTAEDHDSVGLFQQRPSWGTVKERMTPRFAAGRFYAALVKVRGWQDLPLTRAAQEVQVSAYPDAYAKHEPAAKKIVNRIAAAAA